MYFSFYGWTQLHHFNPIVQWWSLLKWKSKWGVVFKCAIEINWTWINRLKVDDVFSENLSNCLWSLCSCVASTVVFSCSINNLHVIEKNPEKQRLFPDKVENVYPLAELLNPCAIRLQYFKARCIICLCCDKNRSRDTRNVKTAIIRNDTFSAV